MKKILLISIVLTAIFAFAFTQPDDIKSEKECTVYVKWYKSSGSPAVDKKIVGYTSTHPLSTEGTNIAYTDSKGKVTLKWDSYKDLVIMYVDGTKHEGTWTDDGTYTFVLD